MVLAQTRATLLLAGRGARDRWCGPTTSEAGRRDPLEGALEQGGREDRDEDQDEDDDRIEGVPDDPGRKGGDGDDQANLSAGRHSPPDREGLVQGHLREAGRDAASEDLCDDGDRAQDDRERNQAQIGGDGGKVDLEAERDKENRGEDGSKVARTLGEVVPKRRVGEQASREKRADDRRQPDRLGRGREEERDRHRDDEPSMAQAEFLALDLDPHHDPPKEVEADRDPDEEESNRFAEEDREIDSADPTRRRPDDDREDDEA